MHVVVIGGTGFIGRALVGELAARGHRAVVTSRSPERAARQLGPSTVCKAWDGSDSAALAAIFDEFDAPVAVVNLAGEPIASGRWTEDVKARIRTSRVNAARAVADAVKLAAQPPAVVVQGSAVGYYGAERDENDAVLDERTSRGNDFLAEVCRAWEEAASGLSETGVRLAVARTGLVIGPGGILEKFLPPFRWFAGGPLGSGGQWMPWIHLSDQVGALIWLVENGEATGAYNLCAPMPVTMRQFCRTLGRVLGRPSWLPVPAFALRLLLGREMADQTVLASQRAVPARLMDEGYAFKVMELRTALHQSLGKGDRADS